MAAFPLYSNFAELALSEEGSTTTADNRTPFPEDHELGCTFVSTPPPDLLCRVCGLVLRDPHQTQCCGNHYCGYCLRIQLNARSQCAFCSSRQVHSFRDVSVTRRINKLQVRCPHQDRGCGWSGELGGVGCHLETCVGKPRACRSCGGVFSNKVIAKHEKTLCYKRKFQCPHCKHCNSTYERVRDIHWPKCLLFPISCPNDCKCNIPRKDVLKHLREGCDVKKKLSQLSATVDQLQTQLTEKEAEIKELQLKVLDISESSKLSSLEEDNVKLVVRITDIQRERSELEHDNLCLQEDIQLRDRKIQELEKQNGHLKNSLRHMECDLNMQLHAMKSICETLRDEKETLERRLGVFSNGGHATKSASQ